jgi:hypothetical protein
MSKKRRNFSNELKFTIVLEALKGQRQIAEIASEYAAESGLLTLCTVFLLLLPSDPVVTNSALAIWIAFPLIWATPASFSRPG